MGILLTNHAALLVLFFAAVLLRLLTFVFGTHIACKMLNVSYDGLLKFQP